MGGDDRRRLVLCEKEDKLASGAAYRLLRLGGVVVENNAFLWSSPTPSRVKFFVWLLALDASTPETTC